MKEIEKWTFFWWVTLLVGAPLYLASVPFLVAVKVLREQPLLKALAALGIGGPILLVDTMGKGMTCFFDYLASGKKVLEKTQ